MLATATYFHDVLGILAILTAIFLFARNCAVAAWVCTFTRLIVSHGFDLLCAENMGWGPAVQTI
jgi:amino acid transporter